MQKRVSGHMWTAKAIINLIRALSVHLKNHLTPENVSMDYKCPDETLRVRGMILNLCAKRMLEENLSLDATF